jgi:hypothetical protein
MFGVGPAASSPGALPAFSNKKSQCATRFPRRSGCAEYEIKSQIHHRNSIAGAQPHPNLVGVLRNTKVPAKARKQKLGR